MKNQIFRGVNEKPIYWDNCLKRRAWTVCRFRAALAKKRGEGVLFSCSLLMTISFRLIISSFKLLILLMILASRVCRHLPLTTDSFFVLIL